MLEKIKKPYHVRTSLKAKLAGYEDERFSRKNEAEAFVRKLRLVDPDFQHQVRCSFRFFDTVTGEFYNTRGDYEREQDRVKSRVSG